MFGLPWRRMRRAGVLTNSGGAAAFDPASVSGYSRDWNFADITKLYTDTAHTTPVTADADPIGAVLCSAGSGVYMVAAADANRFSYKTAIQNSLSVGRADGSDDYLSGAINADASQTIILVLQKRGAVDSTGKIPFAMAAIALLSTDTDFGNSGFNYYGNNTGAGTFTVGGTPTNWNIIALKYTSNSDLKIYLNGGSAAASGDPHNNYAAATSIKVGAYIDGTQPADYDIGRVLVYSDALSDANLNYLFSGLGALYNISVTAVS